ncbi:MAG: membrane protein insertion efficiency factor YidD [Alphaproteobacteria bacterium]|nr:membrane protein insertion efficiency factor YidD [Alphaproteobacteria bacterium]
MLNVLSSAVKVVIITAIKVYKKGISPFLPNACRFHPTCSEYMIEAIEIHGLIKGIYLGIKRICRCHPWGGSGEDPVPLKKEDKSDKFK